MKEKDIKKDISISDPKISEYRRAIINKIKTNEDALNKIGVSFFSKPSVIKSYISSRSCMDLYNLGNIDLRKAFMIGPKQISEYNKLGPSTDDAEEYIFNLVDNSCHYYDLLDKKLKISGDVLKTRVSKYDPFRDEYGPEYHITLSNGIDIIIQFTNPESTYQIIELMLNNPKYNAKPQMVISIEYPIIRNKETKKYELSMESVIDITTDIPFDIDKAIADENIDIEKTREEIRDHIKHVADRMNLFAHELIHRGEIHDASKLEEPEIKYEAWGSPKLKNLRYKSDAFNVIGDKMWPGTKEHYANNRHHIQHHKNGVLDMTLIDLLEMVADWKSASERYPDADIRMSIRDNADRSDFGEQLKQILLNTIDELETLDGTK